MERTFESGHAGRLILACALTVGALTACGSDDNDPVVTTASGQVRGVETATANNYLGIPYAADPSGANRWKAPAAVTAWSGVRDAQAYGANCAQPASPYGVASTSENCLFLNVYTPKTPGPHPVMVWIHGGAFYLGQSNAYKPDALVAQNNVVVTINYRLGALGFLAHPALTAESTGSGNYGLMDQQAALRWVKTNIANFGGNKDNVTIFGESAGGFSVNSHLASASSAGLFHKAIAMSGAYPFAFGQDDLAAAEAKGTAIATGAGCAAPATAACLRGLPVAQLLAQGSVVNPSGPVPNVDKVVLTQDVKTTFTAGAQAKVPVIQGNTRDEWRLFVAQAELGGGAPVTTATYVPTITATLGPIVAGAAALYPAAAYPTPSEALGAIGTDAVFSCSGRASAKLLAAPANSTVYSYEFADRTAPAVLPGALSFPMGAAHTTELQYLFTMGSTLTTAQRTLADTIVGYFSRFALNGDPNGGTALAWPKYTSVGDQYLTLAPTVGVSTTFAADHKCAVWTPGV